MTNPQSRKCQFDATTIRLGEEYKKRNGGFTLSANYLHAYAEGRNSAKASLEILARAVQAEFHRWLNPETNYPETNCPELIDAIAEVKQRGDWPLEETE